MNKIIYYVNVFFPLISVFFMVDASAKDVIKATGILQAYWMPQSDENGQPKSPYIMMRFFETNEKHNKTFYLYESKNSKGVKDYFEENKAENFIKEKFKNIPEDFFKFKEGHAEQYGIITYSGVVILSECDNKQNFVKLNSFISGSTTRYNLQKIESRSGCDSQPYSVMYTIKSNRKDVFIKSRPSEQSENIESKPIDKPLVKVKTVNDEWEYVALYDATMPADMSKIKGYIRTQDLEVAN